MRESERGGDGSLAGYLCVIVGAPLVALALGAKWGLLLEFVLKVAGGGG